MSLSFKQRIIIGMTLSAVLPLILVGGLSLYLSYSNATKLASDSLHNAHGGITARVGDYLETVRDQMIDTANSESTVAAVRELTAAAAAFDASAVSVDRAKVAGRYEEQVAKTEGANAGAVDAWQPTDAKARALQYLYVSGNPNPLGSKRRLDNAGDGSAYSAAHARVHPQFRRFVDTFAYYDLFLFDAASGRMVYSVTKGIDFQNSANTAPLAETELGKVVKLALASTDARAVFFSDVKPYLPNYNNHGVFAVSPVVENGRTIGAVALQIPSSRLNGMFGGLRELGKTVDGYITGTDMHLKTPMLSGAAKVGDSIPRGLEDAVRRVASSGKAEDVTYINGQGDTVNGVLGKIEVLGLEWLVLVRIEYKELMASTYEQLYFIFGGMVLMMLISSFLGYVLSVSLVKPITALASSFGTSSKQVNEATSQVTDAVGGMIAASEETAAQSKVIRKSSSEAAGYVKSVAQAVGELNISINDISQSIGEANVLIDDAVEKARKTDDVVRHLGEAAGKITEVVGLINGLAEQTNLLALNAAIEAARAGDAGRGFAVVADEVKKLATHTSEATVEIQDQVQSIKQVAEQSVSALHTVVDAIHRIRDSATTVSAAVEEQSGVAKQIANSVDDAANRVQDVDANMGGIEQASNDTGVAADQVSGAAQEVKGAFSTLQVQIGSVLTQMGIRAAA